MSMCTHAQEWISALSGALDSVVQWDGVGECVLAFHDNIEIIIAGVPDTDYVSLRCALSLHGERASEPQMQTALLLNYGYLPPGYTAALDTGGGQIALLALTEMAGASQDVIRTLLNRFLQLVPMLREQLSLAKE